MGEKNTAKKGEKKPTENGIPRVFIMLPDKDGIDTMKSLEDLGIQFGSAEFWDHAQRGNAFAIPAGSVNPIQIGAIISDGRKPEVRLSAPVDMFEIPVAGRQTESEVVNQNGNR